jgi:hypothetical protein
MLTGIHRFANSMEIETSKSVNTSISILVSNLQAAISALFNMDNHNS